jgi:hypothetical protein
MLVDMTTDQITTTNAYRLFTNRLCQSCPFKTQCSIFNKLIDKQVGVSIHIRISI